MISLDYRVGSDLVDKRTTYPAVEQREANRMANLNQINPFSYFSRG